MKQHLSERPFRQSSRSRVRGTRVALAAWVLAGLLCMPALIAQVEQGVILGTVRDTTRGVLPGVTITVTHLETNRNFSLVTDDRGFYRSMPLRVGRYSVAGELPGFRRTVRTGVTLAIQQEVVVDLVMEIGEVTDEVTVTADAPLLQATEASRGEVIRGERIVDLPLDGRYYLTLALLTAGTNVSPPGARGGGFSSGGMRASHNTYILDGIDNQNYQHAGTSNTLEMVQPSVDAIQEFKVQTNSYSAEFGGGLGAVVNVAIKSGTNRLRGGVFGFLRDESVAARNFFADETPPYNRKQFGGQLGGPVRTDRTFFFGSYEGTLRRESRTVLSTIPTMLERMGDFSKSIYAKAPVRLFNPATYDPKTRKRQAFLNNVIPANRLDPVGLKLASFYPEPNRSGFVDNYLRHPQTVQDDHQFHVRVDHTLSAKDSLFARFSYVSSVREAGSNAPLPAPAWGADTSVMGLDNQARSLAVSYSRLFSARLHNDLRFGYNRLATERSTPATKPMNEEIGLKGTIATPGMVLVGLTTYRNLGSYQVSQPTSKALQITDHLSWIGGRSSLKVGFDLKFAGAPQLHQRYSQGRVYFDGRFTRQTTPRFGGHPIADLLLGAARRTDLTTLNQWDQGRRLLGTYAQHDFRVTPKLSFNLGVRHEYIGPWVERDNRFSNFDIDTDPNNPYILLAGPGGIRERSTLSPDYNNFAPRLGLAYRLTDLTVIRAGYGIFYGSNDHWGDRYLGSSPPYHFTTTALAGTIEPVMYLRDGFPPGAITTGVANMQTISVDRGNRTSYAQHWNLTVQRELRRDLSFEIGYVGTKGTRLLHVIDPNQPEPGPGAVNPRRPWTTLEVPGLDYLVTLADTYRRQWSANSNYHALETRVEKRLSGGLSLLASYGWSKAISDARGGELAGSTSAGRAQNIQDLSAERSLADEHRPHRFVTSLNYTLPFGRGHRFLDTDSRLVEAVLGGWSVGAIFNAQSGRVVDITTSGDPANTGSDNRPNLVGDWKLPRGERTIERWFNTDSFVRNAPYTFGNAGRNLVQGPGYVNLDLALFKSFRLSGETRLQFRAEAFNATNTAHFGAPGGSVGTGTFGRISSAEPARIIQFGLKFDF